ncbi:hypothetical protein CH373_16705 [Leptospira perolatii]|uniref:Uncharacterized protein n=1 Tax=Leptospira perolatii TaxID=2023191 RepID=A0A2M9ZIY5_9LEPT|nr:hypothetical protein [Leptospira perolatii]PJZ68635.1 hypothetical protein CH360_15250 [Leptospira perolatii]PJZ71982.1 hypothetical protein CH373_16705 [Leptospira perolatii]
MRNKSELLRIATKVLFSIMFVSLFGFTAEMDSKSTRARMNQAGETSDFSSADVPKYFPLEPGNRWWYSGKAKQSIGPGKTIEKNISIEMRVLEVIKNREAQLFILEGHPSQAVWYLKPEHKNLKKVVIRPERYAYLSVGGKLFEIRGDSVDTVISDLRKNSNLPNLDLDDIAFEFPLFDGQKFGGTKGPDGEVEGYDWQVDRVLSKAQKSLRKMKKYLAFQIIQRALSSYTEIQFEPYSGITKYKYIHHGSVCEVYLDLREHHLK